MTKTHMLISSAVLAVSLSFSGVCSWAQEAPQRMFLEQIDTHPTKSKEFKEGWEDVLEEAKEHDYPFTTFVSRSGPRVTMATPISSFADIDSLMEHRNRVYAAGGKKFEKAIAKMDAATYADLSFVVTLMEGISNPPSDEDMAEIKMFEISQINVHAGQDNRFQDIMTSYKAKMDSSGMSDTVKYNVYRGSVGANASYYLQTFAKNGEELAAGDAAIDSMMGEDEAMKDLFQDFLSIAQAGGYTDSTKWYMARDLSYFAEN